MRTEFLKRDTKRLNTQLLSMSQDNSLNRNFLKEIFVVTSVGSKWHHRKSGRGHNIVTYSTSNKSQCSNCLSNFTSNVSIPFGCCKIYSACIFNYLQQNQKSNSFIKPQYYICPLPLYDLPLSAAPWYTCYCTRQWGLTKYTVFSRRDKKFYSIQSVLFSADSSHRLGRLCDRCCFPHSNFPDSHILLSVVTIGYKAIMNWRQISTYTYTQLQMEVNGQIRGARR